MKTWKAALAHIAIAALQGISAAQYDPETTGTIGTVVQAGAQIVLSTIHAVVAKKNSETAPNGRKLYKVNGEDYITDWEE